MYKVIIKKATRPEAEVAEFGALREAEALATNLLNMYKILHKNNLAASGVAFLVKNGEETIHQYGSF